MSTVELEATFRENHMDPVTQGALGAAAALSIAAPRSPLKWATAAWLGALGGMAPDLDILIRSSDDPLLAIEYHRHFTHSLSFIPIGGPLSGLPTLLIKSLRQHWRWVLCLTTIGYATHALLDAFTTYGTMLWWPWSDHRASWRVISVIDPLFTAPLLAAVLVSATRASHRTVLLGLGWAALYLSMCGVQHARALGAIEATAARRGHTIERVNVFPSFANNVTWRSLYRSGDTYHVDKVRVPWLRGACVSPGVTVPVVAPVELNELHPEVARGERLIRWFSSGWVAFDPSDPTVLGDLRYSFEPRQARPIWGIRLEPIGASPKQATSVRWVNNNRSREVSWEVLRTLVFEDAPDATCL